MIIIFLPRSHSKNGSLLSMMADLSPTPRNTFPYRGYTVLGVDNKQVEMVKQVTANERPVWYVFTGEGCTIQLFELNLISTHQQTFHHIFQFFLILLITINKSKICKKRDLLRKGRFECVLSSQPALCLGSKMRQSRVSLLLDYVECLLSKIIPKMLNNRCPLKSSNNLPFISYQC